MIYKMGELDRWAEMVVGRIPEVVTVASEEVTLGVVEGSALSGAPGQPVRDGTLKISFHGDRISPLEWQITTNLVYAPLIEEGVGQYGPLTLRSKVGGFHSVALVRNAWPKIADEAVRRVVPQ